MLIGHLADLHALGEGELLGGKLDTNALAQKAVAAINASAEKPAFVVVCGDLTHHGRLDEMGVARKILDELTVPYYVMPGGHDDTETFWKVFGDLSYLSGGADVRYIIDEFAVRLVVADTTTGKGRSPAFDQSRSAWLREALRTSPGRPTVLGLHHPPFQCRIPVPAYIEDPEVHWAEGLKEVVAESPAVKAVFCGHVHRSIQSRWANTLVSIAPSTNVQSLPRFDDFVKHSQGDERAVTLTLEPPGFQYHWWNGAEFATYTLFANEFRRLN